MFMISLLSASANPWVQDDLATFTPATPSDDCSRYQKLGLHDLEREKTHYESSGDTYSIDGVCRCELPNSEKLFQECREIPQAQKIQCNVGSCTDGRVPLGSKGDAPALSLLPIPETFNGSGEGQTIIPSEPHFIELSNGFFAGSGGRLLPGRIALSQDLSRLHEVVEAGEGRVDLVIQSVNANISRVNIDIVETEFGLMFTIDAPEVHRSYSGMMDADTAIIY